MMPHALKVRLSAALFVAVLEVPSEAPSPASGWRPCRSHPRWPWTWLCLDPRDAAKVAALMPACHGARLFLLKTFGVNP